MIGSYFEWLMRIRKILFVLLLVTLVLSILGIKQLEVEVAFDIFSSEQSPYVTTLDRLKESFTTNQLTVLLSFDVHAFEVTDLFKALSVTQRAERLPSFEKGLTPQMPLMELTQIREGLDIDYLIQAFEPLGVLSPLSLVDEVLYYRVDLPIRDKLSTQDLKEMEAHLDGLEIPYYLAGDDYMQNKLFDYILAILFFLPPLAIGSIFLVFSWQMGSIKATILSVLPAIIASLWMMGLVGWTGSGVSITTVLAPIFTLIIGSADGLHFISHFQEAYTRHLDKRRAVLETLEMVGMPMIVTTLTTMVGFLSLLTVGEEVVSTLVIIASGGVLLAGLATWWVLPILLTSRLTLKPIKGKHHKSISFLKGLWGRPIGGLALMLTLATLVALPRLKTDFNQLMFYKENTELYQSFEVINKTTGGGVPLMIAFTWDEDEEADEVSRVIELALEESPYISRLVGVASAKHLIDSMDTSSMLAGQLLRNLSGFEKQFVDVDRRVGRVIAFPSQFTNESLEAIEATVMALPLRQKAEVTSVQYIMRDLNYQMVRAQGTTQAIALVLVFLLILLALRKFQAALIALVPILLTMFFLYGYLALLSIPLNLFTILMFSISIGIGIDYAIHFVSVWLVYTRKGMSTEEAIHQAFHFTSRPILANAIGLALGMSALMLSPLKIHMYLSLVMWFTMSSSVLLTLTLLPTILKKTSR